MNNRAQFFKVLAISAVATIAMAGCTTDGGHPSSIKKTNSTGAQNHVANSNLPAVTGSAGSAPTISAPHGAAPTVLETQDVIVGTGATAVATSTLTVHYTLMAWSTGKVVESSWTSGQPATFPLAQVIPGWQQGMPGMKEGGRRLLVIPPALGYGTAGAGPIGPNETLIFVVDLVKVA
jgi:peptidylprolyl isomerase